MKKTILGLVAGLVLGSTVTAVAGDFLVERANFPILVNGKAWTTDKPIVTIDGSTYLPLRALGNALGVKVAWNDEKGQVEIGETPIVNYSFSNPAPIGTTQQISFKSLDSSGKANVTVKEIIRGEKAWEEIKAANSFNEPAAEGFEYILAKVDFKLLDFPEDKSYSLSSFDFDLVSSKGKAYEQVAVITPSPEIDTDLYKGASNEGYVGFIVAVDDKAPKIAYKRDYDGSGGIWFKAFN